MVNYILDERIQTVLSHRHKVGVEVIPKQLLAGKFELQVRSSFFECLVQFVELGITAKYEPVPSGRMNHHLKQLFQTDDRGKYLKFTKARFLRSGKSLE